MGKQNDGCYTKAHLLLLLLLLFGAFLLFFRLPKNPKAPNPNKEERERRARNELKYPFVTFVLASRFFFLARFVSFFFWRDGALFLSLSFSVWSFFGDRGVRERAEKKFFGTARLKKKYKP